MDREEAFALYAEQPRPRNLKRFAAEVGLNPNTARDWQRKGHWNDRLALLDAEADGKVMATGGQQARFLQQAQEMQEAGRSLLAEGDSKGGLLIERGVKLEQAALSGELEGGAPADVAATLEAYGKAFRQHIAPLRRQFEARAEAETDDRVADAWRQAGRDLNFAMADFADELNTINGYSG